MNQDEVLHKIHEDLELLKKDVAEIKEVILIEPELREEVKAKVAEARKRVSQGNFVRHEDLLKEFGIE